MGPYRWWISPSSPSFTTVYKYPSDGGPTWRKFNFRAVFFPNRLLPLPAITVNSSVHDNPVTSHTILQVKDPKTFMGPVVPYANNSFCDFSDLHASPSCFKLVQVCSSIQLYETPKSIIMSVDMTPPTSSVTVSTWDSAFSSTYAYSTLLVLTSVTSFTDDYFTRVPDLQQISKWSFFPHLLQVSPRAGQVSSFAVCPTLPADNTTFGVLLSRRFSWMSWNDFASHHIWPRSPVLNLTAHSSGAFVTPRLHEPWQCPAASSVLPYRFSPGISFSTQDSHTYQSAGHVQPRRHL